MGIFLLAAKDHTQFSEQSLRALTKESGLETPIKHDLESHWLYLSKKALIEEELIDSRSSSTLAVCGTPIYRQSTNMSESIELIHNDLQKNCFDYAKLRGSYGLIFYRIGENIEIIIDPSGIQNIFYSDDGKLVSNSFLALIRSNNTRFTINRMAAVELISTGRQIGPDTVLSEIRRVEPGGTPNVEGISVRSVPKLNSPRQSGSFQQEIDKQLECIQDYFEDVQRFGNYYGVDTGLTSGHDSRMMLGFVRRNFHRFQVHSYWRKRKDTELTVAEKVAEKAGVDLWINETRHHFDLNQQEMEDNLLESLLFYDGQVRMHCFYTEPYNTREHRTRVLRDKLLGINGVGGEQYRNEWHIERKKWSFAYFIEYFLGYQLGGRCFKEEGKEKYFDYLRSKIISQLGLAPTPRSINRLDIQRYLNEVYVRSLMAARTNAENKLAHFITPYVDWQLIKQSYSSVKHHGISFKFQQEMIRQSDPELAAVMSGYGYDFVSGEPLKAKLKYLIKEYTPKNLYQSRLDRVMFKKGTKDFDLFMEKYSIINHSVEDLRSLQLPIEEKFIICRPDLMPVYISLAYLISYLKSISRL